jgi:hypothetical protein
MRLYDDPDDDLDDDDGAQAETTRAANAATGADVADLFDFLAKSAWGEVAALHAEADADGAAFYAAVVRERDAAVRDGSWSPVDAAATDAPAAGGDYLVGLLADTAADYAALVRIAEAARDAPGALVLAVDGAGERVLTLALRVRAADAEGARRLVDVVLGGADDPPGYAQLGEPERVY